MSAIPNEVFRQYNMDKTLRTSYDRDGVLSYILENGKRISINSQIDEFIKIAEKERQEEKKKAIEDQAESDRIRDENYYNVVADAVGRGEILVLVDGAVTEKIPKAVYLHEDILLMGKLILEKASGNRWYHYTPSWSLCELPVLSLKECTLITVKRPAIEG